MPDETKPGEQKPGQTQAPKGIEDVLKELPKISVPNPVPPKPAPQTSPPSLKATEGTAKPSSPSLPPRPQTSSPFPPMTPLAPKSPSPPSSGSADKFQSFIRTMESDLEAAKKGQKPEPKPFEIKPPPPGPAILTPPPLTGPKTPQSLKLGPTEKTKPLEPPKPPSPQKPMIPAPSMPSGLPKPKKGFQINPKLLIIILAIAVAFAGIWFFMTRQQEPEIVFTPTPTATPIPAPLTLSELIRTKNQITIPSTQNFETALKNEIKNISVPAGGFAILEVLDENGGRYSLSQMMTRLAIKPSVGFLESLDPDEWALVIYSQTESFDKSGFPIIEPSATKEKRIGLIGKTDDQAGLRSALNTWEVTMTNDLKGLLEIAPKKATSETFLDNIYLGQSIRYRNFPYADQSIDYSLVYLADFNADYFVLTNSRESIYSVIDLLENQ